MMTVMLRSPSFTNRASGAAYVERPDFRPETKFERRGKRLGHKVYDLIFDKCADALDET